MKELSKYQRKQMTEEEIEAYYAEDTDPEPIESWGCGDTGSVQLYKEADGYTVSFHNGAYSEDEEYFDTLDEARERAEEMADQYWQSDEE